MINFIIIVLIIPNLIYSQAPKPKYKVVNGKKANIASFPHMAAFSFGCVYEDSDISHVFCGASIINQKTLLTAGHCLYGCNHFANGIIHVGDNLRFYGEWYAVKKYKIHDDFYPSKLYNDIAMIASETSIKFGPYVKRVLFTEKMDFTSARLGGWGATEYASIHVSNKLLYITEKLTPKSKCESKSMLGYPIPKNTFCGGSRKSDSYTAIGDSGGGLVAENYYLIGILSFSYDIEKRISIYTEVRKFYKWIKQTSMTLSCQ